MDLPHFEHLTDVPDHFTTRAGLKRLGVQQKPEPAATVTSYGKTVFLYDLRKLNLEQNASAAIEKHPKSRVRVKGS